MKEIWSVLCACSDIHENMPPSATDKLGRKVLIYSCTIANKLLQINPKSSDNYNYEHNLILTQNLGLSYKKVEWKLNLRLRIMDGNAKKILDIRNSLWLLWKRTNNIWLQIAWMAAVIVDWSNKFLRLFKITLDVMLTLHFYLALVHLVCSLLMLGTLAWHGNDRITGAAVEHIGHNPIFTNHNAELLFEDSTMEWVIFLLLLFTGVLSHFEPCILLSHSLYVEGKSTDFLATEMLVSLVIHAAQFTLSYVFLSDIYLKFQWRYFWQDDLTQPSILVTHNVQIQFIIHDR